MLQARPVNTDVLVAHGRRMNGVSTRVFDPTYFANKHLVERDVLKINRHFAKLEDVSSEAFSIYCAHISVCPDCASKLESAKAVCSAGLNLVIDQESGHSAFATATPKKTFKVKMK